ncbi:MAG: DUF5723 family protein [Bacteroidales bacterium]|nr:DUF5723 family protein [Bacteroidales bacterium]
MKKTLLTIAAVLMAAAVAYSQDSGSSTYFLRGYTYAYKLNPAFSNDCSFFSMPAAGNVVAGANSNLGIRSLIMPKPDGQLATFLHKDIDQETALAGFQDLNRIGAGLNETIFAFGVNAGKTYHSFDLSLRTNVISNVPGSLFTFMKVGNAGGRDSYDFGQLGASVNAYLEGSYGFTYLFPHVRFGFRVKMLTGLASAEASFNRFNLTSSSDKWTVSSLGSLQVSMPGDMGLQTKEDGKSIDWTGIKMPEDYLKILTKPSLGGALDLGVEVKACDGLYISAAVLDLGGIYWQNRMTAMTPDSDWTYSGFGEIPADGEDGVKNQLEQMGEELADLVNFQKTGEGGSAFSMLPFTANAGIEYRMPFWQGLSVGALCSYRYQGVFSCIEGRGSINISTGNCFSVSGSYGYGTYGHSLGAAISLHLPGFNLFVGADNLLILNKMSKQYIPTLPLGKSTVNFGLNFLFDKKVGKHLL